MSEPEIDLVPALVILAQAGVPTDIQELLVAGNPMKGIAPGALARAILAERERCAKIADEEAAMRQGLYDQNGAGINAYKAVQAEVIADAIRRGS